MCMRVFIPLLCITSHSYRVLYYMCKFVVLRHWVFSFRHFVHI